MANTSGKITNPSGGPLAYHQKEYIIQLGVLGLTRKEIVEKFKQKYNRPLNPRTITNIWSENREQMDEARNSIVAQGGEILTSDVLKQKSYKQLNRRLDRAEQDETEIEKLRLKFRAGEISKREFDVEVSRYEQMTINELIKIADMGHEHAKGNPDGPALTPEDQAALAVLVEGMKNGNPLQLIQVLNPTINAVPNVETPVHPVGTP